VAALANAIDFIGLWEEALNQDAEATLADLFS